MTGTGHGRALGAAVALLLLECPGVRAHSVPPEAIVAELNGARARAAWGVERAERDPKAPRLLVVRVGARWYELPQTARREQAAAWLDRWRHSVDQGLVAILDARSDAPVVQFGPGGVVRGLVPGRGKAGP